MVLGSSLHVSDNMLVITIHEPVTTEQRAALVRDINLLLEEHKPAGLVLSVTAAAAAATAATVSVVLRVHRHCTDNGLPMTVATPPAAARYLIKANQPTLPVHTDTHDALQAARTLLRR
ncbi:hypothetical protein ACFWP3_20980 [Streptomyces sp. NPDC058525]|uniref:hypothetical protein n=1 Tax=Streptomyces sp. NPDC058525 TaxID=3346538 RepID=UPI00366729EF